MFIPSKASSAVEARQPTYPSKVWIHLPQTLIVWCGIIARSYYWIVNLLLSQI